MQVLPIIRLLVAMIFLISGICKSLLKKDKLLELGQSGVEHLEMWQIRFIGFSEVLGAVAFILPLFITISNILIKLAALGFIIIMIFAAFIHARRGEGKVVVFNFLLLGLSLLVFFYSK